MNLRNDIFSDLTAEEIHSYKDKIKKSKKELPLLNLIYKSVKILTYIVIVISILNLGDMMIDFTKIKILFTLLFFICVLSGIYLNDFLYKKVMKCRFNIVATEMVLYGEESDMYKSFDHYLNEMSKEKNINIC